MSSGKTQRKAAAGDSGKAGNERNGCASGYSNGRAGKSARSSSNGHSRGNANNISSSMSISELKSSGHYNHALFSLDKCHNNSIPCCNAIRDIVLEILPDVIAEAEDAAKETLIESEKEGRKDGKSEKDVEKRKNKAMSSSAPTLLSQIVRQHLLDQRGNCNPCNGKGTASNSAISNNNMNGNNNTNTKSKKKRKKKKKKQSSETSTSAESNFSTNSINVIDNQSSKLNGHGENNHNTISNNDPLMLSTSLSTVETTRTTSQECTVKKSSDSFIQNCNNQTSLNALLDHALLLQNQTPSQFSPPPLPPQNRTLKSLFDYIDTNYHHHTNPNSSNKTNNHIIKTKGKTKNPKAKTATPTPNGKEFLRIPLREISNHICEQIKCVPCKRDTEQYLDEISKKPLFQNNISGHSSSINYAKVDWGSVMNDNCQEDEEELSNAKSRDEDDEIIRSFHLNSECIVISEKRKNQHQNHDNSYNSNGINILGPHGLVSDSYGNNIGVEPSFDYALMEEGNVQAPAAISTDATATTITTSTTATLEQKTKNQGLMMNIVKDRSSNTKYVQLSSSEYSLSVTTFIDLIKDVIIPCGLHELEKFNKPSSPQVSNDDIGISSEENVSHDTIAELRQRYDDQICDIVRRIKRILNLYKSFNDILNSLKPSSNFDVKAIKAIWECEKYQFEYMEEFADLLIKIHKCTTHARLAKHDERKWIVDLVEKLWKYYEDTIKAFVEPSLDQLWKVIQLDKKHTGSVPQTYICPIRRQYLIDMLTKKSEIIRQLQTQMETDLVPSMSYFDYENPSEAESQCNLTRLVVLSSYFSWLAKDQENVTECNQFDYKFILTKRNDLVCKSILHSEVSKIINDHATRIMDLRDKTQGLVNDIDYQNGVNECTYYPPQKYSAQWNSNKIFIEEKGMEDEKFHNQKRSYTNDTPEVSNLCGLVEYVCKQSQFFVDIQVSEQLEQCANPKHLKAKVPQWLNKIHTKAPKDDDKEKEENENCHSDKCEGGGGQRRVMCILAACLYSWVQERSMEWHADLTHEELLIDADEEFANLNTKTATASRTKKSKKKKRKASTKKETNQNIEIEVGDTNESTQKSDLIHEESEIKVNDKEKNDDPSNEDGIFLEQRAYNQDIKQEHEERDSIGNETLYDDFDVNIIVDDRKSQFSVQEYLRGRFLKVLKDEDFVII